MIGLGPHFTVEPWLVREPQLDLENLGHAESVLALSNGHIGLRANFDEGEPFGTPGTYLNAYYEERPLPYAESAYGMPEASQVLINVTNGKVIRLLVDDEQFDMRYGEVERHERVLDVREGVLRREVDWRSPNGVRVRVRSTRMVSFVHRTIAAIGYEVEPLDERTRIVVQSELVTNEPTPGHSRDPRDGAALEDPLVAETHHAKGLWASLTHQTRVSRLRMTAAMDHVVEGPEETDHHSSSDPDLARVTVTTVLEPGQPLRLTKFIGYAWSSRRSHASLRDQVDASLASARRRGFAGLLEDQRTYLEDFWHGADVEIEGDPELQQALRFALFQVLQAGARAENRAIPAKGLTGPGYDGHTFWDMETFTLPVLTYTAPAAAADALRWRHSVLDLARERAQVLCRAGAAFPWRTIRGQECSGYWPAGTAAFHIGADIADAVRRYVLVTGDTDFERDIGVELLVETARLWRSLGHHDAAGVFHIDGVTGPDEYSAVCDDNLYTNLMAARNLQQAAVACRRHTDVAARLDVDEEEMAGWRDAAHAMHVPFSEEFGIHEQSERFTRHRRWDFEGTDPAHYPLLLHQPYFELYRSQVLKQADLVHALWLCGDRFTLDEKARDFSYYEAITVRDSSLSACAQAVVAAEVGHLELAFDYLAETALIDLRDLTGTTHQGLHVAALAGAWLTVAAGFGGLRDHGEELLLAPRLPPGLNRISFRLGWRGRGLLVEVLPDAAVYRLRFGEPLTFRHHGEEVTVSRDEAVRRPVTPITPLHRATPPPGRAPHRHLAGEGERAARPVTGGAAPGSGVSEGS